MLRNKKILIIGGCGYLGTALVLYLEKNNLQVDSVDMEWFGNYGIKKNRKIDFSKLTKLFLSNYSVVILLAGHSNVSVAQQDPVGSFRNNVTNFIDLVCKLTTQKFIYASSYRVYGNTKTKVTEREPLLALENYYDLAKITIDTLMSQSKLKYYGLRLATVNGYSPNFRSSQIINKIFLSIYKNKKIEVYDNGANFSVLGINDFVIAVHKIITSNGKSGIYNLSSTVTNIPDICKAISELIPKSKITFKKSKEKNQSSLISSEKFKKIFDFNFNENPETIVRSLLENFNNKTHIISEKLSSSY